MTEEFCSLQLDQTKSISEEKPISNRRPRTQTTKQGATVSRKRLVGSQALNPVFRFDIKSLSPQEQEEESYNSSVEKLKFCAYCRREGPWVLGTPIRTSEIPPVGQMTDFNFEHGTCVLSKHQNKSHTESGTLVIEVDDYVCRLECAFSESLLRAVDDARFIDAEYTLRLLAARMGVELTRSMDWRMRECFGGNLSDEQFYAAEKDAVWSRRLINAKFERHIPCIQTLSSKTACVDRWREPPDCADFLFAVDTDHSGAPQVNGTDENNYDFE